MIRWLLLAFLWCIWLRLLRCERLGSFTCYFSQLTGYAEQIADIGVIARLLLIKRLPDNIIISKVLHGLLILQLLNGEKFNLPKQVLLACHVVVLSQELADQNTEHILYFAKFLRPAVTSDGRGGGRSFSTNSKNCQTDAPGVIRRGEAGWSHAA